jgi:hypothetical protein
MTPDAPPPWRLVLADGTVRCGGAGEPRAGFGAPVPPPHHETAAPPMR